MLTVEIVEFYGIDSDANDFVGALNGMIGYSDANRKAAWAKFCDSLGSVMAETKKRREKNYEDMEQKYSELLLQIESMKLEIKDLNKFNNQLKIANNDLNEKVREITTANEVLTANIDVAKRVAAKAESDLNAEKQKNKISGTKSLDAVVVPAGGTAKVPLGSKPVNVKASDDELRSRIQELIKEKEFMMSENGRLLQLVKAFAEPDPVPTAEVSKRATAEELTKERKLRQTVSEQLKSLTKDALTWNQKFADFVAEQTAAVEKEKNGLQKKISDLSREMTALKSGLVPMQSFTDITSLLGSFKLQNGDVMICPVPTRAGHLMQLADVYSQWMNFPCDNEGTPFASFTCLQTGLTTSLACMEQVCLVLRIAADLQINVTTPFVCKYLSDREWIHFSYLDQITIAAMLCRMYRMGITDGIESVVVSRGYFVLTIHINKKEVDLQMQVLHDSNQTCSACLINYVPSFFKGWKFVNNSENMMQ